MDRPVAFVTGASRGIGAECAAALARAGFDLVITARTLDEGEAHDHVGKVAALPGSLRGTAAAVEALGGRARCIRANILDAESMDAAVAEALEAFGHVDLLLNNAAYQGTGNQERLLDVEAQQVRSIYQANVLTPLALVQAFLPKMLDRGGGTIFNMLSATAFVDPPAPADEGGWGFAYPSSKAALARMAASLRVEHPGELLRVFNIEPGMVLTELMKASGIDEAVLKRFKPTSAASVAAVVAWLTQNDPRDSWLEEPCLRAPAIAKELGLLDAPSLLPPPAAD